MDFSQNLSMEEAFALAEAEAKLRTALQESTTRFETAQLPNKLNEDWRYGSPNKFATALADVLQSSACSQGRATVTHDNGAAVAVSKDDEDLLQTEMLMPSIGSDALLGMHLARFGEGYALYIEESTKEPICLHYEAEGVYTPSTFIMVAPGVKAHVIEHHEGQGENATLFVTRNIQVAEGAELHVELRSSGAARYMCITNIQNMGGKVNHFTGHAAHQWGREETVAEIYSSAEGTSVELYSANKLSGNSVLDQHTKQIHHVGGAYSNLLYKNVVDDHATAIFAGNIRVEEGAHQTDAYQANRNLLLSEKAGVHSLPGLEILADRVRCSHGSASSPVDEEALFYLCSRGIPRNEAYEQISSGFLNDAYQRFARGTEGESSVE